MSFSLTHTGYVAGTLITQINRISTEYDKCNEVFHRMVGRIIIDGLDIEAFMVRADAWTMDHSNEDPFGEVAKYDYGRDFVHLLPTLNTIIASRAVLAGALLQLAKQTISYHRCEVSDWPVGRLVGKQALSQFIQHARNQSMHFEEGGPRRTRCDVDCCRDIRRKLLPALCHADVMRTQINRMD